MRTVILILAGGAYHIAVALGGNPLPKITAKLLVVVLYIVALMDITEFVVKLIK